MLTVLTVSAAVLRCSAMSEFPMASHRRYRTVNIGIPYGIYSIPYGIDNLPYGIDDLPYGMPFLPYGKSSFGDLPYFVIFFTVNSPLSPCPIDRGFFFGGKFYCFQETVAGIPSNLHGYRGKFSPYLMNGRGNRIPSHTYAKDVAEVIL